MSEEGLCWYKPPGSYVLCVLTPGQAHRLSGLSSTPQPIGGPEFSSKKQDTWGQVRVPDTIVMQCWVV